MNGPKIILQFELRNCGRSLRQPVGTPGLSPTGTHLYCPSLKGRAYTLIEIMIVVAIIGTLASLAIPLFAHMTYRAQVTRAINDLRILETEIDTFEFANSRAPVDLAEIDRAGLTDPWGNPYVYMSFAAYGGGWKGAARKDHSLVPLNSTYDLYSMGQDGKSAPPLTAKASEDDIVRANDGGYLGLGSDY
jgi:general secretion pathway protein G